MWRSVITTHACGEFVKFIYVSKLSFLLLFFRPWQVKHKHDFIYYIMSIIWFCVSCSKCTNFNNTSFEQTHTHIHINKQTWCSFNKLWLVQHDSDAHVNSYPEYRLKKFPNASSNNGSEIVIYLEDRAIK